MELKPGNKSLEAGAILDDWDTKTLGDFVSLQRGHDLTERDRRLGEVPVFGSAGLNGFHDTARAKGPGVVLGRSGASFGRAHYCPTDYWPHNTALYVTDFHGNEPLFVYYLLQSIDFSRHNSGGAQQSLNRNFIAPLVITVPKPSQQRVIAQALSDADALIASLERLLAKKRDIKQGVMQELLTGKRRLPGFTEPWEERSLGEITVVRSGGTPSTARPEFWDGDVLWCTPTDITALKGRKYLRETARRITEAGLRASSAEVIPPRSIVMTSRATIGDCAINTVDICTNQGFKNLIPKESVDAEFLYYFLGTQKQGLISLCAGSTFLEIGKTQVENYRVRLPADKAEQCAIAEVLSDLDDDLAGLEERLVKARLVKQGMAQELLTGRIRLK